MNNMIIKTYNFIYLIFDFTVFFFKLMFNVILGVATASLLIAWNIFLFGAITPIGWILVLIFAGPIAMWPTLLFGFYAKLDWL